MEVPSAFTSTGRGFGYGFGRRDLWDSGDEEGSWMGCSGVPATKESKLMIICGWDMCGKLHVIHPASSGSRLGYKRRGITKAYLLSPGRC
jgi:hypothetical protein